jgi:mannitol-specific phosphotransferase system IIBC component
MAQTVAADAVNTIVLACEAGMGSSLMSVNALKKKLKKANIKNVKVLHKPARAIPQNADIVIVHKGLAGVARSKAPDAVVVTFSHFLNDPAFDYIVDTLAEGGEIEASE